MSHRECNGWQKKLVTSSLHLTTSISVTVYCKSSTQRSLSQPAGSQINFLTLTNPKTCEPTQNVSAVVINWTQQVQYAAAVILAGTDDNINTKLTFDLLCNSCLCA